MTTDKELTVASKKSSSDKAQPDVDSTAPVPEPAPVPEAETVQAPVAREVSATPAHRTRGLIAAGAAGLLLAGGLVGFGIGRHSAEHDAPGFNQIGQFRPGQGQGPGRRGGQRGDHRERQFGPGSDQGSAPDGQPNNAPAAPSQGDSSTSGA